MDFILNWEDGERSFYDSDRFEDDSLCSYISDSESCCNNWRGWKRQISSNSFSGQTIQTDQVLSLVELSAKSIANNISFETVEQFYPPIPESLQLRIAYWSFPDNEDDIRMYSCLANGNSDEFIRGEQIYKMKGVSDILQIGFHLSSTVWSSMIRGANGTKSAYNVAITFDKMHITSCNCTCSTGTAWSAHVGASWCAHVVATSLFRIYKADEVCLRAPVSESLSRLQRDQLQKFAQYLISELPQQILPTAQRLLDEMLSSKGAKINMLSGAPDPTAGPAANEQTTWCLDEPTLHDNIKKALVKFSIPQPVVHCDVSSLGFTAPPAAAEWQALLKPLRSREPEGLWNLLLIVREMFQRNDVNAMPLLEIITLEILDCDSILTWWWTNRCLSGPNFYPPVAGRNGQVQAAGSTMQGASCLCDEIVQLWRIACLDPMIDVEQRSSLTTQLSEFHCIVINTLKNKIKIHQPDNDQNATYVNNFSGFRPAIEASRLDWNISKVMSKLNLNSVSIHLSNTIGKRIIHAKGHPKSPVSSANLIITAETIKNHQDYVDNKQCIPQYDLFMDLQNEPTNQELSFAMTEAYYCHGYIKEALIFAKYLAEDILSDIEYKSTDNVSIKNDRKGRKHSVHNIESHMAVKNYPTFLNLTNGSFLCQVLSENRLTKFLAFRIGILCLEMPRMPGNTKFQEVRLVHQESEIVSMLRRMSIEKNEYSVIKEQAEHLKNGQLKSRGEALLPISLANIIFDILCNNPLMKITTADADEKLGFDAAVIVLGLKSNISEAEHPLLCEGIRRQRGELALSMLVHYRDDPSRIAKIMDKLLDKDIHQLYKTPPPWSIYLNELDEDICTEKAIEIKEPIQPQCISPYQENVDDDYEENGDLKSWQTKFLRSNLKNDKKHSIGMASIDSSAPETTSSDNSPTLVRKSTYSQPDSTTSTIKFYDASRQPSTSKIQDTSRSEIRSGVDLRQGILQDVFAVDSDSGSNKSSDSEGSFYQKNNPLMSSKSIMSPIIPTSLTNPFFHWPLPSVKISNCRYKGKSRLHLPVLPNQPSEALAHFMFELAKSVLSKAGVNNSQIFNPIMAGNISASTSSHLGLHICAFQLGLYALGLHNCVSSNWASRTFSSYGCWIQAQATDIGPAALSILLNSWEGHLTPSETIQIADKTSRGRDPILSAELALSCLKYSTQLNTNDIRNALLQCKDQNNEMLKRACLTIENAAKDGGSNSEVLFEVAKRWYELYEEGQSSQSRSIEPNLSQSINKSSQCFIQNQVTPMGIYSFNLQTQPPPIQSIRGPMPQLLAQQTQGNYRFPPMPNLAYQSQYLPWPYRHRYPQIHQQPIQITNYSYTSIYNPQQHVTFMPLQYPQQGSNLIGTQIGMPPQIYIPSNAQIQMPPIHNSQIQMQVNHNSQIQMPPTVNTQIQIPPNQLISINGWETVSGGNVDANLGLSSNMSANNSSSNLMAAAAIEADNYLLLSTYRVGMLAMEMLSRRMHDDRPANKFGRTPLYAEDVKWLLVVATKLGVTYVQEFCNCVCMSLWSPFLLYEVAVDAFTFLSTSQSHNAQQVKQVVWTSLLQRSLQMFVQCCQARIHHIPPGEYEDFVNTICTARQIFSLAHDGPAQFNEMLTSIKKSKSCKRDLWQKILSALHNSNLTQNQN